jgi:hypothetical protein
VQEGFALNPHELGAYSVSGKEIGTEVVKKSERSEKLRRSLHFETST